MPDYVCRNRCYGMFSESSESSELFMGEEFTCDFNVEDPRSAGASTQTMRHTGGTTLAVDLDQNGLKDLILGDVTGNELFAVMLMESSNGQDSAFTAYFDFPATFSNTLPAVMTTFLGAYYVDVNNDDVKDLLVSPNSFSDAEDRKSLMLYINEGENDLPAFVKIQDDFLQESMIDLGNSAYPVIFDVNQDGRKDLLIANRKYFELGNNFTSIIHYYQNTGTAEIPQFELIDDNWLNIPAFNWQSVYPTFGDLNGDGAFDLIAGDQEGVLHLMQNAAPAGQPVEYSLAPVTLTDGNDELIDVGQNATPQLFDVDNDGLLDLLIGELNGCVNYYRNTGTQQDYSFILQEDSIGDVAATSLLGIQGRSVPHMIRNGAGLMELFIGTETGQINHYTNIENNIFGQFDLVTTDFENIREGEKSAVTFGDLTNDGLLDLFVGNIAGGVGFYRHIPVSIENEWQAEDIRVYPNPATDRIIISINGHTNQPVLVHVYDVHGKCIMSQNVFGGKAVMSVEALPKGLYVLKAGNAVCRLIK